MTQTNKLDDFEDFFKGKACVPKTLILCNEDYAYIPCISLRTRLCWLSLAGNSVIYILFLDFVRFVIGGISISVQMCNYFQ